MILIWLTCANLKNNRIPSTSKLSGRSRSLTFLIPLDFSLQDLVQILSRSSRPCSCTEQEACTCDPVIILDLLFLRFVHQTRSAFSERPGASMSQNGLIIFDSREGLCFVDSLQSFILSCIYLAPSPGLSIDPSWPSCMHSTRSTRYRKWVRTVSVYFWQGSIYTCTWGKNTCSSFLNEFIWLK